MTPCSGVHSNEWRKGPTVQSSCNEHIVFSSSGGQMCSRYELMKLLITVGLLYYSTVITVDKVSWGVLRFLILKHDILRPDSINLHASSKTNESNIRLCNNTVHLIISHFSLPLKCWCIFDFHQAGLTVRAVQKFLLGTDMSLFTTEHLDGNATVQPYPTAGTGAETTDTYQSPPFTENLDSTAPYQVPIY